MSSEELMDLYISETQEHLEDLNAALLSLEKKPNDEALVNETFRICHNLKSEAAGMAFDDVAKVAHQMENVLDKCRQSELTINTQIADIFFECMDVISQRMDHFYDGINIDEKDIDSLITRLKSVTIN